MRTLIRINLLLPVVALILLSGCQRNHFKLDYTDRGEILGTASLINLQPNTTDIFLEDYFRDVSLIDSVTWDFDAKILLSGDKKVLRIIKSTELPRMMEISCWIHGTPYSLLARKSEKEKHLVSLDPAGGNFTSVQLAGEMNGWNPTATDLELVNGVWQTELLLNPGVYQYQFVADGDWMLDPANPDSVDNNAGGFNSLLRVGEINTEKIPVLFTNKVLEKKVRLGVINEVEGIFVFWQNFRLPRSFFKLRNTSLWVNIPEQAADMERSYIRVWVYNPHGISNDILIPLENGKVVQNTEELNRHDHHKNILYNVFIDRFNNGDPGNDEPVEDPEILPKANYFGGDISGVVQKIKDGYFNELGVNTIWVSPLVQNPKGAYGLWPEPKSRFSGYHGYWPVSFTKIDYRYGTSDELKELVETAHQNNLNVLLDFVANHVHEEHPVYKAHPDWATELYLPDGTLNTEKWDEHRLTTWFDVFLPTLDLSKPEVYEMLTDSAVFWIKKYKLDGFRHDATKHVPEIFWRTLTRKLKDEIMIPENRKLYQIGETYGNPELISSYVSSGQLDGQFDFNVYDDALAVFARGNESFNRLNSSLEESFKYYGNHNLMGYITGNQDRPRFISLAGGDLQFEEDSKLAGWTREIGVGDPVAYKKLSQLTAFLMTIPGLPVIYFGDEIGDPGGNDPDNRRMMRFTDLKEEEEKTMEIVKKLTRIRSGNMAFLFGDYEPLVVAESSYVYARTYFNNIGIVVFNNNDTQQTVSFNIPKRFKDVKLEACFGSEFIVKENEAEVIISPNSFEILINQ